MYALDKELARKVLLDELNYHPFDVDLFLRDYPPLHDDLGRAVDQWLTDRTVADVAVEGLSIQQVMRRRRSHFLAAVRDLNTLLDETIPAEKRRKFRDILSRPAFYS